MACMIVLVEMKRNTNELLVFAVIYVYLILSKDIV